MTRRAFLVGVALPAGGLNPSATLYLSRTVTTQATTMDELKRLIHYIHAGMLCGVLLCLVPLAAGVLLALAGSYTLATVIALGPFLSLHALWHYHVRRS